MIGGQSGGLMILKRLKFDNLLRRIRTSNVKIRGDDEEYISFCWTVAGRARMQLGSHTSTCNDMKGPPLECANIEEM